MIVVSHIQRIGCQPEKTTLHGGQSRSRGNKRKKKKSGSAPPPPPRRSPFGESRDASTCLGATQVSIRLASAQGFLQLIGWANVCRFARFYASVCDNDFPIIAASLFSWRCLAASTSSFLHAAMNLRPPSATLSTHHTSASSAVAFQSPAMPNARVLLFTQSVHFFSFPPRPLRTAPSRFPKKRFALAAARRLFG